ncbi:aspartate 1-decarboxylase [bacterium]|nr:aspartate 1-decarboxylase [bacterium]
MWRELMKSKIHRAAVTDANLNYMGSITIDQTLMEAADIGEYEKVHIVNINNGHRFETYVIAGKPDSGTITLNGAAARLVQPQDKIIIISYGFFNMEEQKSFKPRIIFVDDLNKIIDCPTSQ